MELGNPIEIIKLDIVKGIAKSENKIDKNWKLQHITLVNKSSFILFNLFENNPFLSSIFFYAIYIFIYIHKKRLLYFFYVDLLSTDNGISLS